MIESFFHRDNILLAVYIAFFIIMMVFVGLGSVYNKLYWIGSGVSGLILILMYYSTMARRAAYATPFDN